MILGDANGTGVIKEDGNRLTDLYLKICKVCFIQRTLVQKDATAMYYASAVDNEIEV